MAQTATWAIPYPDLDDPADIQGAEGLDNMAQRLDVLFSQLRAGSAIPGEVKLWPGGVLPVLATYGRWAWADGAVYTVSAYPLAAAHIATQWRTAHGQSDPGAGNFRVPDLRGVAPVGMDAMPGGTRANRTTRAVAIVLAGRTGEETHVITIPEMPSHDHGIDLFNHSYGGGSIQTYDFASNPNSPDAARTRAAGGGQAHENMQPTIFVPWIVKLDD